MLRSLGLVAIVAGCTSGVVSGPDVDEQELPGVAWTQPTRTVLEGATTLQLRAELTAASAETVAVAVTLSSEVTTATAGEDFVLVGDGLIFPPGAVEAAFEVTLFDENDIERDELVVLRLTEAEGARLGETEEMALRIADAQTPTAVAADAPGTTVDLAWVDNSSDEAGFYLGWANEYTPWRYTLWRGLAAESEAGSSWDLPANAVFGFRVAAMKSWMGERGELSETVLARTPPLGGAGPAAPSALDVAETFARQVSLTWQDNAGDENGFRVERAAAPGGAFAYLGSVGPDVTSYADLTVEPETSYAYRVKAFNAAAESTPSLEVVTTTTAVLDIDEAPGTWLIVLSNRGTPVPPALRSFLCNGSAFGLQGAMRAWMRRETGKYGQATPFDRITCLDEEVTVPAQLESSGSQPLDEPGVVTYLLGQAAGLSASSRAALDAALFVSVVHYLPAATPIDGIGTFVPDRFSFLYFFPEASQVYYPEPSIDLVGRIMLHELLHALGATDKYMETPVSACLTNPATGKQYEGHDLMCHRVYDPTSMAYYAPPLELQTMSRATADEIF